MKFFDILTSANGNLLRNKGRSFLTILAIFIGTFTIILTTGINTGVNNYIDKQLESAGGEGYIEIMPEAMMEQVAGMMGGSDEVMEYNPNGSEMRSITEEDIEKIKKIPGMQSVKPSKSISSEYITSNETDKKYTVNVNEVPTNRISIDMAEGDIVSSSDDKPQIALLPGYAKALGFESDTEAVGKTVRVAVKQVATGELAEVEAEVSGVQNKSVISMSRSWINNALFNELYDEYMDGMPDQYKNQVYYATGEFDPNLTSEEVSQLKEDLKEIGFLGMTVEDQVGMMKTFFDAITTVLTIFGVIALIAASIGIINTLFMAVQERTREIGLMKAMGLGSGKIYLMFSLEAIMLGFWGSAFGIALAQVARVVANSLASQTFLKDLPGFTLIEFRVENLVVITLIVMFIAFLAGSMPARQAAKKDPIDALRYE